MADPASYRPAPGAIPTDPGVYRFVDGEGRVLYVGKAKSLRARLSSYFQDPGALSPRIRQMVHTAEGVEWVVVGSEVEALTLEYSWIKEYTPRFNVVFRDNKSYPYLAISVSEEFPRVWVTRQEHRRGTRYLGPYTKVWAIRDTLDQLLTVFPMRSCAKTQFNQSQRTGRPCLYGHIGRCAAPCVGRIDAAGHRDIVDGLIRFMEGDNGPAIAERKRAMAQAAANEEYETAARYRDEIAALEAVNERNAVVFSENLDADVFGVAFDELEASVQVFYVRGGRIRGQQAWISDEIAGLDAAEIVSFLLLQVYGSVQPGRPPAAREGSRSVDDRAHTPLGAIPSQIWVPALPGDRLQLEAWLAERRGGAVRLKNPRRGDKARLAETVRLNAVQALQRHKLARAGDITVRSQGLEELRLALDLERAPLRIECYDVSHTQGTHQVASMVVFEDGLAKKPDYRHFNVRGPEGEGAPDDTAAMDEVLRRRLGRLLDERGRADDESGPLLIDPTTGAPRRFSYAPALIVVDGGAPQVAAASRVLQELGLAEEIALCGLAKRLEEVWLPDEAYPVILPRASEGLYLLQRVRDEAHRFAITHHRGRRSKSMLSSALDGVSGLGELRRKALISHFGSLKRLRAAGVDEIAAVPGFGPKLAAAVHEAVAGTGGEAINLATGEVTPT